MNRIVMAVVAPVMGATIGVSAVMALAPEGLVTRAEPVKQDVHHQLKPVMTVKQLVRRHGCWTEGSNLIPGHVVADRGDGPRLYGARVTDHALRMIFEDGPGHGIIEVYAFCR